jgi:phytoene dehydrogenase-like protein
VAALDPALVRRLDLERHGLTMIRPAVDACAPSLDGRALVLWNDRARAVESIRGFSAKDAAEYPRFLESFARSAACFAPSPRRRRQTSTSRARPTCFSC